VIWPGIQGFRCYHCGESGDVINLVELFKRCDHATAAKYLADRVGMPHPFSGEGLSSEELSQREVDAQEENLVYDMLTTAAEWFHQQLNNYPGIVDHLKKHYGFSPEIVEELKIGIAPPGTSDSKITSDLANYFETMPEFRGKLAMSGLFTFRSCTGFIIN